MKNNFKKILLIPSVIFLVLPCFVFFLLNVQINSNQKIFEENEASWQKEANRREGIKVLNNSIKKIENDKDLIEAHFAKSSNVVPFLDTLESLGAKSGVKTEVTLVDIPNENNVLMVEMKASGNFEGIYKFLLLLENSPYELEFVSVDVQKQNAGTVISKKEIVPIWEANFKMKLLSFVK